MANHQLSTLKLSPSQFKNYTEGYGICLHDPQGKSIGLIQEKMHSDPGEIQQLKDQHERVRNMVSFLSGLLLNHSGTLEMDQEGVRGMSILLDNIMYELQ